MEIDVEQLRKTRRSQKEKLDSENDRRTIEHRALERSSGEQKAKSALRDLQSRLAVAAERAACGIDLLIYNGGPLYPLEVMEGVKKEVEAATAGMHLRTWVETSRPDESRDVIHIIICFEDESQTSEHRHIALRGD